jgi:hypothetical protein
VRFEVGLGGNQPQVSPLRGEAADGFDFGKLPFEISGVDFTGKTIIQRTSAATRPGQALYAASLVTVKATVRAVLSDSLDQVSSVAMGDNIHYKVENTGLAAAFSIFNESPRSIVKPKGHRSLAGFLTPLSRGSLPLLPTVNQ